MHKRLLKIGLLILTACLWCSCSENEVLETYEEIQDSKPVPISFNPYYRANSEEEANTRAFLSYFTYYNSVANPDPVYGKGYFRYIPYLGYQGGSSGSWGDSPSNRFGRTAYNSYIVGLFAYSHESADDWSDVSATATANIMTNQPLLCVTTAKNKNDAPKWNTSDYASKVFWKYAPQKYWPNGQKVTFIAYYPFQDYNPDPNGNPDTTTRTFVDGTKSYFRNGKLNVANESVTFDGTSYIDPYGDNSTPLETDLRNIIVPAKDADAGAPSYTFSFTQKEDVRHHVDFLMGISSNQTKSNVDANGNITLNMRHTLCAVRFNFLAGSINNRVPNNQTLPTSMTATINKVGLEGLFTEGDVYPDGDHASATIIWDNLRKPNSDPQYSSASTKDDLKGYYDTYMVDFDADAYARYANDDYYPQDAFKRQFKGNDVYDERPKFELSNGNIKGVNNYTAENIYNNDYSIFGNNKNVSTGRGIRYLLLVIPQKAEVANKEAYLVMDYDMTCTYSDGQTVVYKGTQQKIKLTDPVNGQLFNAGKMLTINVTFNLNGIAMDVSETDWEDDEERQLPIENKETGDNGGE